jgi:ribonuclease J
MFPEIIIYAPRFAKCLAQKKLERASLVATIIEYGDNDQLDLPDFFIEPIRVNHSIPDTFGLVLLPKKTDTALFYVSDFKYDEQSRFDPPINLAKLAEYSKTKTQRILLADSTNILSRNTKTESETSLCENFESIFAEKYPRIFLTTFSSNIERIKNIADCAKKQSRKAYVYGGSMFKYVNCAIETGLLQVDDLKFLESKDQLNQPCVVIVSGCQGDFKGTFRRIAGGYDAICKPRHDDCFVLSSRSIPGNEKKISLTLNKIAEIGSTIITSQERHVHVSGHAGKEDLKKVYHAFKPTQLIPIHGEHYFLNKHQHFSFDELPGSEARVQVNFDTFEILNSELVFSKHVPNDDERPILIHGNDIEIEREAIKQKRKIAENGIVLVNFRSEIISTKNYALPIHIQTLGLPKYIDNYHQHLVKNIHNVLKLTHKASNVDIQTEINSSVRSAINGILGYKPTVVTNIL